MLNMISKRVWKVYSSGQNTDKSAQLSTHTALDSAVSRTFMFLKNTCELRHC